MSEHREVVHRQAGTFGSAVGSGAGCVVGIAVGFGLLLLGGCVVLVLAFGGCQAIVGEAQKRKEENEAKARATARTADEPTLPTRRTEPTAAAPKPDPVYILKPANDGLQAFLGADEAVLAEADSGTLSQVSRLLSSGKLVAVREPVEVVVVNRAPDFCRVRVASGELKGKTFVARTRAIDLTPKAN